MHSLTALSHSLYYSFIQVVHLTFIVCTYIPGLNCPFTKKKIHVNWHINFHIFLLLYSIIPLSSLSKISLLSPFVLSSASSFFTHCAFLGFSGPCSCPTSVIVLPNWLAPLPSFTTSVWIFYMVGSLLSFSFFL